MQKRTRIFGLLILAVALLLVLWIPRAKTTVSAQSQDTEARVVQMVQSKNR
jgi:competence protein ComGC